MAEVGVPMMVFSSSAAVYGSPAEVPVAEDAWLRPESPYGETKAVCEWMVAAQRRANGLSAVSLRYFNVVGAAHSRLGDTSVRHLVQLIFSDLSSAAMSQ